MTRIESHPALIEQFLSWLIPETIGTKIDPT
jgi:hypothetical protein